MSHLCDWLLQTVLRQLRFFPQWMDAAKAVCSFLHTRAYRDKLQSLKDDTDFRATAEEGTLAALPALRNFHASFAAWRWQTLEQVTRELMRVKIALQGAWEHVARTPGFFHVKDSGLFAAVGTAIVDATFWHHTNLVDSIAQLLRRLRTWAGGCSCHEEQLRNNEQVNCPLKGRRGPELQGRLEGFLNEVDNMRKGLMQTDLGPDVFQDLDFGFRLLAGQTKQKFAWVWELPARLCWQGHHPAVARELLEAYDQAAGAAGAAGATWCFHRVTRRFLGAGALRTELEAHARGEGLSGRLAQEFAAYQLAPLNESLVEGVHRDVSHVSVRAKAGQQGWWAGSLRLGQNLADYDEAEAAGCGLTFRRFFLHYKAILQLHPRCSARFVPVRIPGPQALREVYRSGQVALRTGPLELLPQPSSGRRGRQLGPVEALQKEYLLAALSSKGFFTLPDCRELSAEMQELRARRAAPAEIARVLEQKAASCMCFQVMDDRPQAKKVVGDKAYAKMVAPMMLQRFEGWNVQGYPSREMHIFPLERPSIEEVLALAPWEVLRGALRRWQPLGRPPPPAGSAPQERGGTGVTPPRVPPPPPRRTPPRPRGEWPQGGVWCFRRTPFPAGPHAPPPPPPGAGRPGQAVGRGELLAAGALPPRGR